MYGRIRSVYDLVENLLWKTGGLPSSHSSLVTVRDAVGVRRSSGVQAKKINELGRDLHKKDIIQYSPIKEVHGHTPIEVTVGCLLGFFTGLAFALF